jgi:hypothetical protein
MNQPPKVGANRRIHVARFPAQRWTPGPKLRTAYFFPSFALAVLGFIDTKARPLNGNGALWIGMFLLAYSPWFPVLLSPRTWVRLQSAEPSRWKRIRTVVVANLALGLMYYIAIFGGVPKLLLYVSHDEGTLVTTITRKSDWLGRYTSCVPRIALADISWPFHGDVCVSQTFFKAVKVGDRVRLRGNMSRYAIEPTEIVRIR